MTADLADDPTWLAAYRAGEQHALRRVFDAYVHDVDVIMRRGTMTKDGSRRVPGVAVDAIDDLIQDVFVKVFSHQTRSSFDGQRPFRPYLRQVARFTLVDHHRRSGRVVAHVDPNDDINVEPLWVAAPAAADDVVAQQQLTNEVRAFKEELSADEQAFVQLRFVDGVGQREVAARLQITRAEVRKRDDDVRTRLRAFLARRMRRGA